MELRIVVCIKQVPDPEGPADSFKIDSQAKKVIPVGIPPLINPFDENALEIALRIKDDHAVKVTAISMGEKLAQPVLRKALAAGADELILLVDPHFKDLDTHSTAYVLASAIRKIGNYDIILTGRQAGDWDFGVTGLLIAEILQIPGINLARKVEIKDNKVLVEKLSQNGYEIVRAPMPVLITVSSEVGELRYPSIKALQASGSRPVKVYNGKDIEVDAKKLRVMEIVDLFAYKNKRQCKFIEGNSPQEKGENLAIKLREDQLI
jgi:electron transfer flavoprotein beta subunit